MIEEILCAIIFILLIFMAIICILAIHFSWVEYLKEIEEEQDFLDNLNDKK